MSKINILSNRLPYSVAISEKDEITLVPSVGGLATGLMSVYRDFGGKWIGWAGNESVESSFDKDQRVSALLKEEQCVPVDLTPDEIHNFYEGFSNRTIWPLFHYFTQYADYNQHEWEVYHDVNQKFADAALAVVDDGDTIWVHDYQLLLVPAMIKEKNPTITVGFFLHIPFPSFEVFRLLPWRQELIHGMLGADLLGFHTYDYQRHFFSTVRRLCGYDISFNRIRMEDRVIFADSFPMGIDYNKFDSAAKEFMQKKDRPITDYQTEIDNSILFSPHQKTILSIDRLDYTKGIPFRIRAFERFLESYPQYQGIVSLIILAVPSRNGVDHYQELKSEVDELVGNINGKYSDINYQAITYFYRSLSFEKLIALYCSSDVALITPLRDGMNLVAKEFVATRFDNTGVVVLSEMAGVAKEMGEALLINPNDLDMVANALHKAFEMPLEEQKERMSVIRKRIKRYDVFRWAKDFVDSLKKAEQQQQIYLAKRITKKMSHYLFKNYYKAQKRVIFLDYDGTLTHFVTNPQDAFPDQNLYDLLDRLADNPRNEVVLISGRDKETLGKWFNGHKISLICEHGIWMKRLRKDWEKIGIVSKEWMPFVRSIMEEFVDRTPGTFIETKGYSLVWHYRKAEIEQSELRVNELKDALNAMIANHNLELLEGSKVIEVKNGGINKGNAALRFMKNIHYDSIIAIGDDWTDEYMFKRLPKEALTIKVGINNTYANYNVENVESVRVLLAQMSEEE